MKYTLTLTEQQIAVLGAALQELSFRVAAPVINAINQQLDEQRHLPEENLADKGQPSPVQNQS